MRARFIAISLLFAVCGSGDALAETDEELRNKALARELLAVSGHFEAFRSGVLEKVEVLRREHPEIPRDFLEEFVGQLTAAQISDLLVPIYARHLTVEELEAAVAFYSSPAGRSYRQKLTAMMKEADEAASQWGIDLAYQAAGRTMERRQPGFRSRQPLGASMVQWHAGYLEAVAPVKAAVVLAHRAHSERGGDVLKRACRAVSEAVDAAGEASSLRKSPDRRISQEIRTLLSAYDAAARACVGGRMEDYRRYGGLATDSLRRLTNLLQDYGLDP